MDKNLELFFQLQILRITQRPTTHATGPQKPSLTQIDNQAGTPHGK
jgi:hypothetical protein